jgi:hypothetical protein
MSYVVAILGLAAVCVLTYWVQRFAGTADAAGCTHAVGDCGDCALCAADEGGASRPRGMRGPGSESGEHGRE